MNSKFARQLLRKRRDDLATRLSRLNEELGAGQREMTQELSSYDNHPADMASETYEREKDLGLCQTLRQRVSQVDAALHRLEQGTYGTCMRCSKGIEDDRLEVMPEAELCLQCQRAFEGRSAERTRPGEEDVLDPTLQSRGSPAYDELDTWEDTAQHGTSYSPQDQPGAKDYDDIHREEEPDDGTVEPVEKVPRRP